jgi:hypothetical protein
MTQMEDGLRQALRRLEPSAGFAARVVERARTGHEASSGRRDYERTPGAGLMVRWAAAAVLGVAVAGGGVWYRAELRRQAQGEAAKRQVLVSLHIAGAKLQRVQARVLNQP